MLPEMWHGGERGARCTVVVWKDKLARPVCLVEPYKKDKLFLKLECQGFGKY